MSKFIQERLDISIPRDLSPHWAKALRQTIRLGVAKKISGISTKFPLNEFVDLDSPIILFGSGASILDFDFQAGMPQGSISITLNDAAHICLHSDFHSYEPSRETRKDFELSSRLSQRFSGTETEILCRLPQRLGDLRLYPDFVLKNPNTSHLYTSVSALPANRFIRQLDHYFDESTPIFSPGIDPGFSLGRLILRLLKIGFTDLRLVGVDLFTPEHFYHLSNEHKWLAELHGSPKLLIHDTVRPERVWPAPYFLETLESLQDRYGFSLSSFYKSGSSVLLPGWRP